MKKKRPNPSRQAADAVLADGLALAGETSPDMLGDALLGDDAPTLDEKRELFLQIVETHGCTDGIAALMVGVSRWSPWRWRKDPDFAAKYKAARKVSIAHLVSEAERRAMNGSDRLLEFLLTNYAPDKFSNRAKLELSNGSEIVERLTRGRVKKDDGADLAG